MLLPEWKTVVVLGAGPAGLSIGSELKRRNVDFLILEKGDVAGESFQHYPKNIVFGPWLNDTLPGSTVPWSWKLRRATQPGYAWYLGEYAAHKQLPIQYRTEVLDLRRTERGFRLQTSTGSIDCRLVVNCSGYFSSPYVPDIPGLQTASLTWMHSRDYREAGDLICRLRRESGEVLVVGAGLSAGETMVELHKRGFHVGLSHRRKLVFGPASWKEALLSPFMRVIEKVAITLDVRLNSHPPMAGGLSEQLVREGKVTTYPVITSIDGNLVHFADGRSHHFDAIVFATGYGYTRKHLRGLLGDEPIQLSQMESTEVPGLFFLGLDQQRTYRSRFLRGIRSDSIKLAELLQQRLQTALARDPVSVEDLLVDLERLPVTL